MSVLSDHTTMTLPRRQSDTSQYLDVGDNARGGSLRMRNDKSRARIAIPCVGDEAGLSPLKQLQRLKEAGSLSHLPKKHACIPLDCSDAQNSTARCTGQGGRLYSATLPRNMGRPRFASEPNVLDIIDGHELKDETDTDVMTKSDGDGNYEAGQRTGKSLDDINHSVASVSEDESMLPGASQSDKGCTLTIGMSPIPGSVLTPNYTPPTPLQFLSEHPLKHGSANSGAAPTQAEVNLSDDSPTSPPLPPMPQRSPSSPSAPLAVPCPTVPPLCVKPGGSPTYPPPPPPGTGEPSVQVSCRQPGQQVASTDRQHKLPRSRSRPKRPAPPPPPPRPAHVSPLTADSTHQNTTLDTSLSSSRSDPPAPDTRPLSQTSFVSQSSFEMPDAPLEMLEVAKRTSKAVSEGAGSESDTSSSGSSSIRARLPPPPPPPNRPSAVLSPTRQQSPLPPPVTKGVPLLPGGDRRTPPKHKTQPSVTDTSTPPAKPKVLVRLVRNESPAHRWSTSSEGSYHDVNQNRLPEEAEEDSSDQETADIADTRAPGNIVRVNLMKRETASEERELNEIALKPSCKRLSKSAEELDREAALALIDLTGPYLSPQSILRTSFMSEEEAEQRKARGIYSSIGDVQTILKTDVKEEERIYSLPQPQSFSEDTLKAVKKITEKYDTLERRKMRAMSFRDNSRCSGTPSNPNTPACVNDMTEAELFQLGDNTQCEAVAVDKGVTSRDVARIDLFYRGRGTDVRVCRCLADLSFCIPNVNNELVDWEPVRATGVPVWVLNTGIGKRKRELFITLAERETGFPLWKDKVNYLSNYREHDSNKEVHLMQLSSNLRKVASLKYYCRATAEDFMRTFAELTGDPNDELWKISASKTVKKRWTFRRPGKTKGPAKKDISTPCNFTHMTKVDQEDDIVQESFTDGVASSESGSESGYRTRLSTT